MSSKVYTSSRFELAKTHPSHISDEDNTTVGNTSSTVPTSSFRDMLLNTVDAANDVITAPEKLTQQAIIDPESVNPQDITIAARKAGLAVRMTTTIVNRALEAYRAIIALR